MQLSRRIRNLRRHGNSNAPEWNQQNDQKEESSAAEKDQNASGKSRGSAKEVVRNHSWRARVPGVPGCGWLRVSKSHLKFDADEVPDDIDDDREENDGDSAIRADLSSIVSASLGDVPEPGWRALSIAAEKADSVGTGAVYVLLVLESDSEAVLRRLDVAVVRQRGPSSARDVANHSTKHAARRERCAEPPSATAVAHVAFPELLSESDILELETCDLSSVQRTLPSRFASSPWASVYSSRRNGFSFHTFLHKYGQDVFFGGKRPQKVTASVLVVKDNHGCVFGAFVNEPWRNIGVTGDGIPSKATSLKDRPELLANYKFAGNGECFLFSVIPGEPATVSSWSRRTEFFMLALENFGVALGGTTREAAEEHPGSGFGLWIDNELDHGSTTWCETFQNPPLCCKSNDGQFRCIDVEVWALQEYY